MKISEISAEDEWVTAEIEKSKKSGKADKQKMIERFQIQEMNVEFSKSFDKQTSRIKN
ncbi:MAG: hypothetical protein ACOCU7_04245 [Tangfeifania sp.]